MECSSEENLKAGSDLLLLLTIEAGIFPVMQDYHLTPRQGMICWVENREMHERLLVRLQTMGGEIFTKLKNMPLHFTNFRFHIHPLRPEDDPTQIMDFLDQEDAMMGITLYGLLPQYLTGSSRNNILVWEDDEKDCTIEHVKRELEEFCNCVYNHSDWLEKQLKKYLTSEEYDRNASVQGFWRPFYAAAYLYSEYYRLSHTEAETNKRKNGLNCAILHFQKLQHRNEDIDNLVFLIRNAIVSYVEKNPEIIVCCISNITGEVQRAIDTDRAVLYDDGFYYLPEKLLKMACSDLVKTVSISHIKHQLVKEGVLQVNSLEKENYTVKLLITNIFGYQYRPRFMKFNRRFLDQVGHLTLRERGGIDAMDRDGSGPKLLY